MTPPVMKISLGCIRDYYITKGFIKGLLRKFFASCEEKERDEVPEHRQARFSPTS
jgi:hypothetical protein